jgi:hypothetical protein
MPAPGPRRIEPELLDLLPQEDPRAMRSRRDLRRVNAWMLQARIMRGQLVRHASAKPHAILELGGGDGTFMLEVARRMTPAWTDVRLLLLDRQALVGAATRAAFRDVGWTVEPLIGDVFELLERPIGRPIDAVCANLFLHHFSLEQLVGLTERTAQLAPLFVACEPRRGGFPLLASRMLWAIGCNGVTRHDAVASVRAGFRERELSALWPDHGDWALSEGPAGLFTHYFVARRRFGDVP